MSRMVAWWALLLMNKTAAALWISCFALVATACDARLTLVNAAPNVGEGEGEGSAGEGEGEGEGESGEGEGDFCTLQPVGAQFPVKLLYALDVSGSTQYTDQAGGRARALEEHIAALGALDALDDNDVSIAVLGWGAGIFTEPKIDEASDPRFIPIESWQPSVPNFMALLDVATDTHAALGAVYDHILSDATRVSPEERLRTRYVVVFVTDGESDPRCCAAENEGSADPFECPLDPWETGGPPTDTPQCDGRPELALCNEQASLDQFRGGWEEVVNTDEGTIPNYGVPFVAFADLEVGGDRNRLTQLEDDVRLLNSIEGFGVGRVDAHFFLLEDLELPDAVKEIFNLNSCRLRSTVDALAEAAETTAAINDANGLDFGAVDVTPLCP